MMDKVFSGLFDTASATVIVPGDFLLCLVFALVLGCVIAASYRACCRCSQSFLGALAMLPAVVSVVIMMVNGNLGIGVAVAGAFGLVRFRSAQGTGREIGILFLAMGTGLIVGAGYLAYAALYTGILCAANMLFSFVVKKSFRQDGWRVLRITIPEDLQYENVFEDVFRQYADSWELESVRTANMGSMFRLTYDIRLKDTELSKNMIDSLRCRNGNLEISLSRRGEGENEL